MERSGCAALDAPEPRAHDEGGRGPGARVRAPLRDRPPVAACPPRRSPPTREARGGEKFGIAEIVMPDRELLPGVEVDTDLGTWQVHETPGHAPSHVVLHQPERGLLLSGDHLLGRVSLYYDFGYTPDPAGEFLDSLDVVDQLDVQLVLAGHGRPVREARAAHRGEPPHDPRAHATGCARRSPTARARAFDLVPDMWVDVDLPKPLMIGWGLTEALCYLNHMELAAARSSGSDGDGAGALALRVGPKRGPLDSGLSRASRGARRAAPPGSPALPASGSACRSGLRARPAPGDRSTGGSRKRPRALQPLPGRRRARSARRSSSSGIVAPHMSGEPVDLAVVRDRHDPRDDRHVDAAPRAPLDEVEVDLVVEEELGDQELGARVDLLRA